MSTINNDMTLNEIRARYYKHIEVKAKELHESGETETDLVFMAACDSYWAILYHLNRLVYIVSDNSDAIDEQGDISDTDDIDTMRAVYAIAADIQRQLEDME